MTAPVRAYVALGSNLGDPVANLDAALRALAATPGVRVVAVSHAYASEPWGVEEQPAFANGIAALDVTLTPHELLAACKRIEREAGREAGVRFGPRVLDLDVLLYGDAVVDDADLTVPHPRMLERDFVVTPLLEIAPDVDVPGTGRPDPAAAIHGRVTGRIRLLKLPGPPAR